MKRKDQEPFIDDIIVKTIPENYTKIPNEVLRNPNLSYKAKGILGLILSNKNGWKNHLQTIASMGKEGRDAVSSGLKELGENGHLIKLRYRNRKTKQIIGSFWICLPLPFTYQPIENEIKIIESKKAEIVPLELEQYKNWENLTPGNPFLGKPNTGKPVTGYPVTGYPNPGNPLLKRKDIKKEKEKEIFFILFKLFPMEWRKDNEFRQLIKEFTQHRKEIKKPLTPRACVMFKNEATKYDIETTKSAIEKSIMSGWSGIFPNKIKPDGSSNKEVNFNPDKYLQGKFKGLTPKYKRFKKRVHDPVLGFFSESNTQIRGTVTKALYETFSTFEQKQQRKDTDFWLETMPDGIEIIEEYVSWIKEQDWLRDISPSLFRWDSQVLQKFLRTYEDSLEFDLFTGRGLY